ncbi:unnamed protein product [Soboliphyme baturini]|uniref:Uncharacterized protein n=1 Tax=Soboliphyme baturini TaxID=241478 RepID=A0A183IH33_9BILA|nr:unnamed protein product [Soboliphyme baturini]
MAPTPSPVLTYAVRTHALNQARRNRLSCPRPLRTRSPVAAGGMLLTVVLWRSLAISTNRTVSCRVQ